MQPKMYIYHNWLLAIMAMMMKMMGVDEGDEDSYTIRFTEIKNKY